MSELNLIHFFDFYLALAFVIGSMVRFGQYEAIVRLVRAVPERWPRLLGLVRQHHAIFLTGATVLPLVVALSLYLINMLACRLIWPDANLTPADVLAVRPAVPFVLASGVAMLGVDLYATFRVGKIDRALLEIYS